VFAAESIRTATSGRGCLDAIAEDWSPVEGNRRADTERMSCTVGGRIGLTFDVCAALAVVSVVSREREDSQIKIRVDRRANRIGKTVKICRTGRCGIRRRILREIENLIGCLFGLAIPCASRRPGVVFPPLPGQ
jgi:hypothetical protein